LNYSSNPAKSGAMTITATYSEAIVGTPKISIDQPGSTDKTNQDMANSGDQTVWTYAYTVNTSTGGTYVDGASTVSLSTVADVASNDANAPTGTTFTIDTTAPTVTITAPTNGTKVQGTATVSFSDNELIVAQCSIDNTIWVACTSGATALSSITGFNALPEGAFTLYLKDTDTAGNTGTDNEAGIIKDTTAPNVSLTYSANPAKSGAMTITATYSEVIVGTPKISIDQPGTNDITAQPMSGGATVWTYAYTVNTTNGGTYVDGASTVSLSSVADAATNNASEPTGTNFTIDTTAPTVAITAPTTGTKVQGTATVSFSDGELTAAKCSIDNTIWVACTSGATALSSITGFNALGEGAFTLFLKDTDTAGNTGTDNEAGIIKDTTAPTVSLTYSANPAKAGAMTITATYSEGIVGTPKISIDQPGSTDITAQSMSGGATVWTYAYSVNTATGGTYIDGAATVSLSSVADAALNNAGAPTGTTFTIDTTVPIPPIVDTTPPTFTAIRTAPNIIVLTFSENVDVITTAGEGYTLSSGTVTANTDPAGSGNIITLITSGVSGSLTVTYGAAAGTTVDTAANEVADGFNAVASSGSAACIAVTANDTSPLVNTTVTINATVKDSSGITSVSLGTGTISFLANGIGFAYANLSDGVASTTYTKATAGAVTITAFYNITLQNTTTVTFMQALPQAITGVTITPTNPSTGDEINITVAINNPGASFTGRVEGNVWSPSGTGKYLGWEDVVIPSGVSTVTIIGPAGGESSSYISHEAGTYLYDVFLENVDAGQQYFNATDSRLGVPFTVGPAASVYMSNIVLLGSLTDGSVMALNVTISNPTSSAFTGTMNVNIWDSVRGYALTTQNISIAAGNSTTLTFMYTPVNTGLHSYDFFMVSDVSGQNTKTPWGFSCIDYVAGIGFTVV
jgi:hypothetical protein